MTTNPTPTQQGERLLPCPLFGHLPDKGEFTNGPYIAVSGAPNMPKFYAVVCPGCCSTAYDENKARVIKKWNTRAATASPAPAEPTTEDMKAACDSAVASLNRDGKWTAGDIGNYTAAFFSGWYARSNFNAAPAERTRAAGEQEKK